ncbi:MAG: hypothetical protein LBM69_00945, partial [Lachnospiraceae bacterium]|nr:hypothetical protein [Lachnospiraceae bacterium]
MWYSRKVCGQTIDTYTVNSGSRQTIVRMLRFGTTPTYFSAYRGIPKGGAHMISKEKKTEIIAKHA